MTKQEAAERVVMNLEPGEGTELPQFGPIVTSIIIQVIAYLITKCGERLLNQKTKPGFWATRELRRQVRRAFLQSGQTRYQYRTHGEAIVKAIVKTGQSASNEDLQKLIASHS